MILVPVIWPMWTFLKSMNNWQSFKSAVNVGWQALGWMR
jgi:hypothetical protein